MIKNRLSGILSDKRILPDGRFFLRADRLNLYIEIPLYKREKKVKILTDLKMCAIINDKNYL